MTEIIDFLSWAERVTLDAAADRAHEAAILAAGRELPPYVAPSKLAPLDQSKMLVWGEAEDARLIWACLTSMLRTKRGPRVVVA